MVLLNLFRKIKTVIKFFRRKYCTALVRYKAKDVGENLRVNYRSSVTVRTQLGNNVNFNGMFIGGRGCCYIGDNFHSGRMCQIMTDYHNYDKGEAIPYDKTYIVRDVHIKDNVWLGNRVTILLGVTLGEGCIIQAGSVVVNDIPPMAVAGGHPAKVFKYRDIDHYNKLKLQKSFL